MPLCAQTLHPSIWQKAGKADRYLKGLTHNVALWLHFRIFSGYSPVIPELALSLLAGSSLQKQHRGQHRLHHLPEKDDKSVYRGLCAHVCGYIATSTWAVQSPSCQGMSTWCCGSQRWCYQKKIPSSHHCPNHKASLPSVNSSCFSSQKWPHFSDGCCNGNVF